MKFKVTLLSFATTVVLSVPTQETKKCARRLCKNECQKTKAWYDVNCVSCFAENCLADKTTPEYFEADCIKTICHDDCQHSNVTPCKRCIANTCDRYQNAGVCEKAKMLNQNNKVNDDFFMRSSNNYVAKCDADGLYEEKQCDSFTGYCSCVDKMTGKNLPGTDFASLPELLDCKSSSSKNTGSTIIQNRNAEQPNGPCTRKLLRFKSKPNRFSVDDYPECDETGFYKPRQCSDKACWCVDTQGNRLENSLTNLVEPSSDEDCVSKRSVSVEKTPISRPATPPNRGNIFGIPVTEKPENEELKIEQPKSPFISLLRPANIPDFNKKNEDAENQISNRSRDRQLCYQAGGVCVDRINDSSDVCKSVNKDMVEVKGHECYSRQQVCCIVEEGGFGWARVFSLNDPDREDVDFDGDSEIVNEQEEQEEEQSEEHESSDSQILNNSNSLQHHICGHGDLKVRCLENGPKCRKTANKFFVQESIISVNQLTKTDQSVSDCADKCQNNPECETFTYHYKIGNENVDCVLRRAVPDNLQAVYTTTGRNRKSGFECGENSSCFSGTKTCQPL